MNNVDKSINIAVTTIFIGGLILTGYLEGLVGIVIFLGKLLLTVMVCMVLIIVTSNLLKIFKGGKS